MQIKGAIAENWIRNVTRVRDADAMKNGIGTQSNDRRNKPSDLAVRELGHADIRWLLLGLIEQRGARHTWQARVSA
jgi:hypothetical protein